jgi:hypothetical protein
MREEDLRVRGELEASGELGGPYVPRMEAVHVRNAARLRELIAQHGWPADDLAGEDGAKAAWFIVQHAIGEPDFQRQSLIHLQTCSAGPRACLAPHLESGAMCEGRPQRFGTQWMDNPATAGTPVASADPEHVNGARLSGPGAVHPIPNPGRRAADKRHELEGGANLVGAMAGPKGWKTSDAAEKEVRYSSSMTKSEVAIFRVLRRTSQHRLR